MGYSAGGDVVFKIHRYADGLMPFKSSVNWYSMFRSTHFLVSRLRQQKKPLPALFPRTGDRTCLRCHPRLAKGALLPTFTLLNAEHVGPYCPKGVGARPGGAIGSLPPAAFAAPAALWRGVRAVTSPALSVFGYWPYYTPQRGKCQTHIAQMSTGWSKYSPVGKCQREKRKGASYHNVLS